jgi:hypothetical protein
MIIIYSFFKTQQLSVTRIHDWWVSAISGVLGSIHLTTNPTAVVAAAIACNLEITQITDKYTSETATVIETGSVPSQPIVPPNETLLTQSYTTSIGTYIGVPHYPAMNYGEISNGSTFPVSASSLSSYSVTEGTITPTTPQYAGFDNLVVYWSSMNRLNAKNHLHTYSNILLDATEIRTQVGGFSGSVMQSFIDIINSTYEVQLLNDPVVLSRLLSTDQSISNLELFIRDIVGLVQLSLQDINAQFDYYHQNRALLMPLLTYTPDPSTNLATVSTIASLYENIAAPIMAANPGINTMILDDFFSFANEKCYTVGDLYNQIVAAVIARNPIWLTSANPLAVAQWSMVQTRIAPESHILRSATQLSTTTDYFRFIIDQLPDGSMRERSSIPLPLDTDSSIAIMRERADMLQRSIINLESIASALAKEGAGGFEYAWIQRLGHHIFEWIEIRIDGECWDTHTGDWLDIMHELMGSASSDRGYRILIGDTPENYKLSSSPRGRMMLTVPLRFWYCLKSGWFLPLVAMRYSNIVIRFKLRELSGCIVAPPGAYSIVRDRLGRAKRGVPGVRCRINTQYVYLDADERSWFAAHRHEYLYQYTQNHGVNVLDSNTYNWDSGYTIKTAFQNPCSAILVATRMRSMEQRNNWVAGGWRECSCLRLHGSSYPECPECNGRAVAGSYDSGLVIEEMQVMFNGTSRQEMRGGHHYAWANTMRGWRRAPRDGIYSWNISLLPCESYPTGPANMSRIDTANLHVKLNPRIRQQLESGDDAVLVRTFAITHGVMRCMSGMTGRLFQH